MKTHFLGFAAACLAASMALHGSSSVLAAQPIDPSQHSAGKEADSAPPVVRGWKIESAAAIKRPSITEVTPSYRGQQPAGEEKRAIGAKKGELLVIQIQCRWATLQPPNEPLWVGKPNVTLVDRFGQEYPAVDALIRRGGEYVRLGMLSNPGRKPAETVRSKSYRLLVYFDVPKTGGSFSLQFPDGGPVIPVQEVPELPGTLGDLPD